MPRKPRVALYSEADLYHVTTRGVGRRDIFEDAADHLRFLDMLHKRLLPNGVRLLAWCLMENHVHLLLGGDLIDVSSLMQSLLTSYAGYFNIRHGHVGHVFQGRFDSKPIQSEAQLLETIRYIHQNPVRAGTAPDCNYRWSSYESFLSDVKTDEANGILDLFGGRDNFVAFHDQIPETAGATPTLGSKTAGANLPPYRLLEDDARAIAENVLGGL